MKNKIKNNDKSSPWACNACHDTGICRRCDGEGCMSCFYTGECSFCAKNEQIAIQPDSTLKTDRSDPI